MLTRRCIAFSALIFSVFLYNSEGMAQIHDVKTAQVDKLFDNFMRRGDLPVEFKVSVYRTSATGLGPYVGTITVRNSFIKVADREEPALIVKANLANLTPGPHAFHVHENPECGP